MRNSEFGIVMGCQQKHSGGVEKTAGNRFSPSSVRSVGSLSSRGSISRRLSAKANPRKNPAGGSDGIFSVYSLQFRVMIARGARKL